ncbi:MAG: glycosyltransferase [Acidimicrobiales bacterium]|nr:glycosyltransferase [Acidimicrobiales bacterium]
MSTAGGQNGPTERRRTVAVYNKYWSTGGGAEKYGGLVAQVLAADNDVVLLGPEDFDIDALADRLDLDLTGVTNRVIAEHLGALRWASHEYDLVVNVSFMSHEAVRSRHSIYIVHFPAEVSKDLSSAQKAVIGALGGIVRSSSVNTGFGEGFYPPEGRRPRYFWASEDASFYVEPHADRPTPLRLVFCRRRPAGLDPAEIAVDVDGSEIAQLTLDPGATALERRRKTNLDFELPASPTQAPVKVTVRVANPFVPAEVLGGPDVRSLGVALAAISTGRGLKAKIGAQLGAWLPLLHREPPSTDFIASYDAVVSNSEFTRRWVQRYWGTDSTVVYPPVTMQARGDKENVILAVGRFFAAEAGHSKKQLEMVEAFRRLVDRGLEGWTLHLVGGCSAVDRPYLEQVQAAAEGLPIELHVDAPGDELRALYAKASIYWQATGLGEDPERDPDRLEHFGIATVEAMSAGAVPVVIGLAGQIEIVQPGVSGFHFATLDELVERTEAVVGDDELRARLSEGAEARARDFSVDAFTETFGVVVDRVVGGG